MGSFNMFKSNSKSLCLSTLVISRKLGTPASVGWTRRGCSWNWQLTRPATFESSDADEGEGHMVKPHKSWQLAQCWVVKPARKLAEG